MIPRTVNVHRTGRGNFQVEETGFRNGTRDQPDADQQAGQQDDRTTSASAPARDSTIFEGLVQRISHGRGI